MEHREFDDIIRKLFEDFQADDTSSDWEALNRRLDEEAPLAESEEFDERLKEMFEQYVPTGLVPDWDNMQHSLEEMEEDFDQEIKEKVEQYEAPYDADTWPILTDKIDTRIWLQRHIVTIKVLEVVAVLLLFVSFYNIGNKFLPQQTYETPVAALAESDSQADDLGNSAKSEETGKLQNSETRGTVSVGSEANTAASSQQPGSPVNRTLQTGGGFNDAANQGTASRAGKVSPINTRAQTVSFAEDISAKRMIPGAEEVNFPEVSNGYSTGPAAPLEGKLALLISDQGLWQIQTRVSEMPRLHVPTRAYISAFVGGNLNSLLIPEDYFYSLGQTFRFTNKTMIASGFSTGASLTLERNRFGFETGLVYASHNYEPERIINISDNIERSTLDFTRISLDVVSIPAHVRYSVIPSGKWRLYAKGGVEMHVLAAANYDLNVRNTLATIAPPSLEGGGNSFFDEVRRVEERILDGAEFKSKRFFTANAAVGLERVLSTRFSAFFQPTYQHQLSSLSATSEDNGRKELKSLSFRLGVRTALK